MQEGRNLLDVAIELTNLHVDQFGVSDKKEIEELYVKYYATVKVVGAASEYNLKKIISDEVLEKVQNS